MEEEDVFFFLTELNSNTPSSVDWENAIALPIF